MLMASSRRGTDVADADFDGREVGRRADIPPQLAAVADELRAPVVVDQAVVIGHRSKRTRQAGARQGAHHVQPIRLEPGSAARTEGGGSRERVQQRQVAPDGGHDADAFVAVAETRVDVHAAHQHPPDAFLKSDREPLVAFPSASASALAMPRKGWVDDPSTAAPCAAAASTTSRRVSRSALRASCTDAQTRVLVSICERRNSWTTLCGPRFRWHASKMAGSGSASRSRVSGSTRKNLFLDAERNGQIFSGAGRGHVRELPAETVLLSCPRGGAPV